MEVLEAADSSGRAQHIAKLLKSWGRPLSSAVVLDSQGRSLVEVGKDHYRGKMAEAREWHRTINEDLLSVSSSTDPSSRIGVVEEEEVGATLATVIGAIRVTASNKAAGIDGLPAEVFKAGRYGAAQMVLTLLKACLATGTTPLEWSRGLVFFFFKRKSC